MKRLALLDALHNGSHAAWSTGLAAAMPAAGWQVELHTLPGRHWKWRMQGAALQFAASLHGPPPDALLVTDMLDAARLRGSLPAAWRSVPLIAYFHENQVSFPWKSTEDRDQRIAYAFANIQSAAAADAVWFNSQHQLDAFLQGIPSVMARLPDALPRGLVERIQAKSQVIAPGIQFPPMPTGHLQRPLRRPIRLLWNHRWAPDKQPEYAVAAWNELLQLGIPFEIDLLGTGPRDPDSPLLAWAAAHPKYVTSFEPAADRTSYGARLAAADAMVHSPLQEYFGISVVEALHAGVLPVLPEAHAYPEYVHGLAFASTPRTAAAAVRAITQAPPAAIGQWRQAAHACALPYSWDRMRPVYAAALDRICMRLQ